MDKLFCAPNSFFDLMYCIFARFSTASTPQTAVYLGKKFERETLSTLTSFLSFKLAQVGGKDDRGIDLIGHWTLTPAYTYNVVVQCKRVHKRIGPSILRELEGM